MITVLGGQEQRATGHVSLRRKGAIMVAAVDQSMRLRMILVLFGIILTLVGLVMIFLGVSGGDPVIIKLGTIEITTSSLGLAVMVLGFAWAEIAGATAPKPDATIAGWDVEQQRRSRQLRTIGVIAIIAVIVRIAILA